MWLYQISRRIVRIYVSYTILLVYSSRGEKLTYVAEILINVANMTMWLRSKKLKPNKPHYTSATLTSIESFRSLKPSLILDSS
jgi:hypothetical protein